METQATISERRVGYDPAAIEPKWQQRWERDGLHRARASTRSAGSTTS